MVQEETRPGEEETTQNERTKKKEKGDPRRSVRQHEHCGMSKRAASQAFLACWPFFRVLGLGFSEFAANSQAPLCTRDQSILERRRSVCLGPVCANVACTVL
jgi:hypothetical protein